MLASAPRFYAVILTDLCAMMMEEGLPNHAGFPFLPYCKPSQNEIHFTHSINATCMIQDFNSKGKLLQLHRSPDSPN